MNTRSKLAASGLVIAALAATAVPVFAADATKPATKVVGSMAGPDKRAEGHRMQGGPLAALVKSGTITRAQAAAVHQALHEAMDVSRAADLNTALVALVKDGTITQAQADAAKTFFAAKPTPGSQRMSGQGKPEPRGARPELTGWTQAQRDALRAKLEQARPDRSALAKAALTKLVTAGTITQQQSDAIATALANAPDRRDGDGPRGMGQGGRDGGGQFSPGHHQRKPRH